MNSTDRASGLYKTNSFPGAGMGNVMREISASHNTTNRSHELGSPSIYLKVNLARTTILNEIKEIVCIKWLIAIYALSVGWASLVCLTHLSLAMASLGHPLYPPLATNS